MHQFQKSMDFYHAQVGSVEGNAYNQKVMEVQSVVQQQIVAMKGKQELKLTKDESYKYILQLEAKKVQTMKKLETMQG